MRRTKTLCRLRPLLLALVSVGAAAVLTAGPGCSKKKTQGDAPSCDAMADHVIEIIKKESAELPEGQSQALEAQLSAIRSELIEDCKKKPETFRAECIMAADTSKALEACEPAKAGDPGKE